jgi:hypothetical protein
VIKKNLKKMKYYGSQRISAVRFRRPTAGIDAFSPIQNWGDLHFEVNGLLDYVE